MKLYQNFSKTKISDFCLLSLNWRAFFNEKSFFWLNFIELLRGPKWVKIFLNKIKIYHNCPKIIKLEKALVGLKNRKCLVLGPMWICGSEKPITSNQGTQIQNLREKNLKCKSTFFTYFCYKHVSWAQCSIIIPMVKSFTWTPLHLSNSSGTTGAKIC